jgi:hypothetical protein
MMTPSLPLTTARNQGIEYFLGETCQWKLESESSAPFIEKQTGGPVCIFANNGFGDYLFLKKKPDSDEIDETVYEFFHEGPEINALPDDLETLLGLKDRPPSKDDYPKAIYETGEPVALGDQVRFRSWAAFWKGWQEGVVDYVPGVSNKNLEFEHGGLKWVSIRFDNGNIAPLVDPQTGVLKKIKFVTRGGP